jgi:hypothetical protein
MQLAGTSAADSVDVVEIAGLTTPDVPAKSITPSNADRLFVNVLSTDPVTSPDRSKFTVDPETTSHGIVSRFSTEVCDVPVAETESVAAVRVPTAGSNFGSVKVFVKSVNWSGIEKVWVSVAAFSETAAKNASRKVFIFIFITVVA